MKRMTIAFALSLAAIFAESRDMAIYGGKLTSALNANGMAVTNLPAPLASGDAANKAYVDSIGGVTPDTVTNIANVRIGAKVADWAMKPNPPPQSGTDTNAVCNLITNHVDSGYLCTVEKAQGMTNDITFLQLKSKPSTLSGYGITNTYTKSEADETFIGKSGGVFCGPVTFAPETGSEGINVMDLYSINFLTLQNIPSLKYVLQNPEIYWGTSDKHIGDYGINDAYTKTETDTAIANATNDATVVRFDENTLKLKHGDTEVTAENVGAVGKNEIVDSCYEICYGKRGYRAQYPFAKYSNYGRLCNYWALSPSTNAEERIFAYTSEIPTTNDAAFVAAFAPKTATETAIANLSTTSATHTAGIATITSSYIKSATATDTSITVTKQDDSAVSLEVQYDYALTNLTAETLTLRSGEIGNYVAPTNFTLTISFADNGRSGDCMAYIANTNAYDCYITLLPTNDLDFVSADLAKAQTLGKTTTNIVSFTRVKTGTVLVSKMEVK